MRDNESMKGSTKSGMIKADPMRESSMRFFKEAFENVSMAAGSESVNTMFLMERQRAEKEKLLNDRQSDEGSEYQTISGAPTSFLKSRRMSAKKKSGMNCAETQSTRSFQKTGTRFFGSGTNQNSTMFNN